LAYKQRDTGPEFRHAQNHVEPTAVTLCV